MANRPLSGTPQRLINRRRKPGGGGPAPIGNLVTYTTPADFQAKLAAAVAGDVLSPHATFAAGAPFVVTIDRSIAAPGISLIGHPSQQAVVRGNGIANARWEFVNWRFSGTAYQGNTNNAVAFEYSDADLNNCSMVSFQGCTFEKGDWGLMLRSTTSTTDIFVNNCVFAGLMIDAIRVLNGPSSARIRITNCYIADLTHQEKTWCKSDNTPPIIQSVDPGTGAVDTAPYNEHHDGIQAYGAGTGVLSDCLIQSNTIKAPGAQCILLTDGDQTRVAILDNTLQVGQQWATMISGGQDCELSRNAFSRTGTNFDTNVSLGVMFLRKGGTGNTKGGLNTLSPGTGGQVVNTDLGGGTAADLTGAIQGTATAPTAPTWTQTTSNVGNLTALRATRPSYTDFAGPAVCARKPKIYVSGPGNAPDAPPFASGSYLKLIHDEVLGWTYPFPGCWIRWKKDGVVQATAQYTPGGSTAPFVSPATTAGSWVGGFSFDSTDGTNGTWYDTDPVAVGSSLSTFQTGQANVTYSNGNLTVTKDAGADSDRNCVSSNVLPTADGWYAWEMTPTLVAGGGMNIGFTDGTNFLDFNGVSWYYNGGVVRSGSPFSTFDGTQKCLILMNINAGVRKIWLYLGSANGWSAADGNPNSGGAGWDISSIGLNWATTRAKARVTRQAETCTANFGQNAYGTTVPNTPVGI